MVPPNETCLVMCPRCSGPARFRKMGPCTRSSWSEGRFRSQIRGLITCGRCGCIAEAQELIVPDMLYLKETTRCGILFAFDDEHLSVLIDFFLSRQRNPLTCPPEYRSSLNRMGRGFLLEKNRYSVLTGLKAMNERVLDEHQPLELGYLNTGPAPSSQAGRPAASPADEA